MGRPPDHPSGAKIHTGFRLAPAVLQRLDLFVDEYKLNRSLVLERLIERTPLPSEKAKP